MDDFDLFPAKLIRPISNSLIHQASTRQHSPTDSSTCQYCGFMGEGESSWPRVPGIIIVFLIIGSRLLMKSFSSNHVTDKCSSHVFLSWGIKQNKLLYHFSEWEGEALQSIMQNKLIRFFGKSFHHLILPSIEYMLYLMMSKRRSTLIDDMYNWIFN